MRAALLLLFFTLTACAPAGSEVARPVGDDDEIMALTSESDGKADTGRQLVFLNFGGARITHGASCSDAPRNCSALVSGTQDFQPFTVSDQWDRPKVVAAITKCVGQFFSDANVDFVTTRPAQGPYTMMMIGAIYPTQLGFAQNGSGPYGRAPVDCGNRNKNDIGFLLLEDDVDPDFYYMCRSIAHELGHTFGMVHTKGPNTIAGTRVDAMCEEADCMQRAAAGQPWDFQNKKMEAEVRACDGTNEQNTYGKLLETLGVRGR